MHALLHDLPGALLSSVPEDLLPYVYLSARLSVLTRETRAYSASYAAMLPHLGLQFPPPRAETEEEGRGTVAIPTVLSLNRWWLTCSCQRAHVPLLWKGRLHHGMRADNICWNTYADVMQALPTFSRFLQQRLLDTLYTNSVLILEDQLGLYALTSTALQEQVRALPLVRRARSTLMHRLVPLQKCALLLLARAWERCMADARRTIPLTSDTLARLYPDTDNKGTESSTPSLLRLSPRFGWQSVFEGVLITDMPQLDEGRPNSLCEQRQPLVLVNEKMHFFEAPEGPIPPILRLLNAILWKRAGTRHACNELFFWQDHLVTNVRGTTSKVFRFTIVDHALRSSHVVWGSSESARNATITRTTTVWLRSFLRYYAVAHTSCDPELFSVLNDKALQELSLPLTLQWLPEPLLLTRPWGLTDRALCQALAWTDMCGHPERIPILEKATDPPQTQKLRAKSAKYLTKATHEAVHALETGRDVNDLLIKLIRWRFVILLPLVAPLSEDSVTDTVLQKITEHSLHALVSTAEPLDIWQLGRMPRAFDVALSSSRLVTTLELALLLARAVNDSLVRALVRNSFPMDFGSIGTIDSADSDDPDFVHPQLVSMVEAELCGTLGETIGIRVLKNGIRHPYNDPTSRTLSLINVYPPVPLSYLYCPPSSPGDARHCSFCNKSNVY